MNKIFTLDDLSQFCISHYEKGIMSFTAPENSVFMVALPASFSADQELDRQGLLPVKIKACHTDRNLNKSNIPEDVMIAALPSLYNRPILANIVEVEDDIYDFGSHDYKVVRSENGNYIEYIERPVGTIPESCNARLEWDEEAQRSYVWLDGYIYSDYGNQTKDILERREKVDVSVEIGVTKFSYDAEKKQLNIEEFYFLGVTLLGEGIEPGMQGASLTLEDFSVKADAGDSKQSNSVKGGIQVNKLEELLTKYSVSLEDLPFADEVEGKTEEEIEALFAEYFTNNNSNEADSQESDSTIQNFNEENPADESDENEEESKECDGDSCFIKYSYKGYHHSFELSLDEKANALYHLVNETYAGENDWYSVTAYDTYVVMYSWNESRYYKQSYTQEESIFTLTGERVEVFAMFVTTEERDAIEAARNKASLYDQLLVEKENEARNAVLNDETYTAISETDEWTELVKTSANYSADELAVRADALYGKFARQQSEKKSVAVGVHNHSGKTRKTSPYGNLFGSKE